MPKMLKRILFAQTDQSHEYLRLSKRRQCDSTVIDPALATFLTLSPSPPTPPQGYLAGVSAPELFEALDEQDFGGKGGGGGTWGKGG